MSLKTCIPKLHSLLKDFDLSEIETAAADYQEAGMSQREAELRAIADRLRELRAEKGRIEAIVIEAFRTQDPEGYAEAQGDTGLAEAVEAGAGEAAETEEERLRRMRERMSQQQEERRARVKAVAALFEANGAVEGHYKSNADVQIILSRNTYPGGEKFRVTSFDENGPMGHREYATVEGAADEFNSNVAVRGLDSDFVAPGARPGQGEANLEAMFDELLAEETQRGQAGGASQSVYEVLRRIPQPDGMEIHVFRNDKGVAAGLYDADAEKYVGQSVTIYSGKDALQKATAKAEDMVAEGALPPAAGPTVNSEPPRRRPRPARQPARPTQNAQPRTAAEALGSAAENTAEGLANAIKGLGELFGGGGKLSSGLTFDEQTYERAKPLFIQALRDFKDAAADLREAMRAIIRMVVEQFGANAANNMRPYVVRFMQDVQAGRIELAGEADVPGTGEDSQRDRGDAVAQDGMVPPAVQPNARKPDSGSGNAVPGARGQRRPASGRPRVPGNRPAAGGERSDQSFHSEEGRSEPTVDSSRGDNASGSAGNRGDGPADDVQQQKDARDAAQGVTPRLSLTEKRRLQQEAESVPVIPADPANIAETLPYLLPSQHEDVAFAERRLFKPDGYGVLFTNGTGTGKTYLGLGIIKRMVKRGKGEGLIVVPSQKIIDDWVSSAENLGLTLNRLESTQDAGRGVSITTYANFGENETLADRDYDFVVADEAHSLMQSEAAEVTAALRTLRALALHPDSATQWARMRHRELHREWFEAEQMLNTYSRSMDTMDEMLQAATQRAERARRAWLPLEEEARERFANLAPADRPRALFLSATPFAYEKNVQWAEGFLFEFARGDVRIGNSNQSGFEQFMVQHFGYRIRYHKLTEPGPEVDRDLMQRQFNTWLRSQGVLSARMLDVDADYDRKFVYVDSKVGHLIDDGLKFLAEAEDGRYRALYEVTKDKFKFLERSRLLEALKAREMVPYIRRQLELGRKLVVFYDYNEGGGFSIFKYEEIPDGPDGPVMVTYQRPKKPANLKEALEAAAAGPLPDADAPNPGNLSWSSLMGTEEVTVPFNQLVREFNQKRPDLVALDTIAMSPLRTLKEAFPQAVEYNGTVPPRRRTEFVNQFNNDELPGVNLILAQKAANAGWSAHDTTGRHPRVLINLGLPTAPTVAIQQEGRIYRVGQASDAMFRYVNTGTSWERSAFAEKMARRAGTAENLAMGEDARGLTDSFIQAFEEADVEAPGYEGEGKGGKARDRAFATPMSEFERAKTFYFAQHKRTSQTKSQEGTDYFATPEPLGLKMVHWGQIAAGESVLEPSAGHGAIARWFPALNTRTVIEPSFDLSSRLSLVTDAQLIQTRFEDWHIVNKRDVIVMNPPFGQGGATAIAHIDKAFRHLPNGGRIVALIPTGPAADKRFDAWLYEENKAEKDRTQKDAYLVADYKLPQVTFERAGTKVATRIVIIDKSQDPGAVAAQSSIDWSDVTDIKELFARIENVSGPRRAGETESVRAARAAAEGTQGAGGGAGGAGGGRGQAGPVYANPWERAPERIQSAIAELNAARDIARGAAKNSLDGAIRSLEEQKDLEGAILLVERSVRQSESAELGAAVERALASLNALRAEASAPAAAPAYRAGEFRHTKTGETVYVAAPARFLGDDFKAHLAKAKSRGGYYNSYGSNGAIKGFAFKSAEARDAFMADVSASSVQFSMPESGLLRSAGIPSDAVHIHSFTSDQPLKSHPSYRAAKAGDAKAAARLVADLVANPTHDFGDAVFVPVRTFEASGMNQIPVALAQRYAGDKEIAQGIIQINRSFHTGADPMERLVARAKFDGPVQRGGRYVLVDDVTTMGGTLADLASFIQSKGGVVVGTVVLTNASRAGSFQAPPAQARLLERRLGNEIRELFQVEPSALTADEVGYLIGFRNADELRNRVAKAKIERDRRLLSKGVEQRPPLASQQASTEARPRAGLSVSEVEKAIGRAVLAIADAIGLKVRVVADQAELPADIQSEIPPGRRPYGLLAPDGTVYLIAANLPNAKAARVALAHEVIGHVGMNAIIPDWKAVRERLSWLVKSGNKRASDIDREVRRRYPDVNADTYAREFIAVAAERRVKDGPLGEILSQIRAAIRRFLTKLGIVQAFPDWEIDVWLSDSASYIRSGRPKPGTENRPSAFSQSENAQAVWFSQLLRTIDQSPMATATPGQWRALMQKSGVKKEEMDWLDIDGLMADRKTVSRDELREHVASNQIDVREVVLGAESTIEARAAIRRAVDGIVRYLREEYGSSYGDETGVTPEIMRGAMNGEAYAIAELERAGVPDELMNPLYDSISGGAVQYANLQVLGEKKNYRELLLTLPPNESDDANYIGPHWAQPNVFAHVRFNERNDTDGARVLFIEEIQSDMHQKGREFGYFDPKLPWEVFDTKTGQTVGLYKTLKEAANRAIREEGLDYDRVKERELVPDAPLKTSKSWSMAAMKRMIRWAAENGFDRVAWTTGEQQSDRYKKTKAIAKVVDDNGVLLAWTDYGRNVFAKDVPQAMWGRYIGQEAAAKLAEKTPDEDGMRSVEEPGLKLRDKGMVGFYDQILPLEVGKYVKKWNARVGASSIDLGIKKNDGGRIRYEGPVWEAKRLSEYVRDNWSTMGFEIASKLYDVVDSVQRGGNFEWLMSLQDEKVAKAIGGRLVDSSSNVTAEVHSFDVTPAMRESVMQGQPLFSMAGDTSSPSFDSTARTYGGREAYERAKAAGRTKLTYGQWVQVRTPEFKAWFGDWENDLANASKVTDPETGEPLVVYHGTTKDFSIFKPGSYFTADNSEASAYTFFSEMKRAEKATGKYTVTSAPDVAGQRLEYEGTIADIDNAQVGWFYATDNGVVQYRGEGKWNVISDLVVDYSSFDETDQTIGVVAGDGAANAQEMVDDYEALVRSSFPSGGGGNVLPVYLNIKSPKGMSALDGNRFGERLGADPAMVAEQIAALKAQGYDGIVTTSDDPYYQMDGRTPPKHYIAFSPTQIKSTIGNRGNFDGRDPRVQFMFDDGFDLPSESTFDYLVRNLQDRFRRVKILQRAIREAGGEVTPESDAYLKEEIFHGKVGARIETFMRDRVEPLLKSMQAAGVTLEELDDYLYAKHAPERNARIAEIREDMPDGGSGMTTDEATAYIAGLPRERVAKLEALARRVWAINQARVDLLEEAGLESPEQLAEWRAGYQFYVPLRGFSDAELSESMMSRAARRLGRGFDIRGKESRRALGRSSRSDSPLVYSIAQMQESIVRAAKNEVGQAFLRLVEENPNPDLWTVHTGEMGDYKPAWDARRGEVVYRRDRMKKLADNVLSVKRDGKEHFIVMEDQGALLARAFKNLGVDNSNAVVRFFAGYNRYMAAINTSLNPEFVLTNFARDLQTAAINLVGEQDARGMLREPRQMGRKVLKDIPKAMRGAFLGLYNRSPNDPWVRWFNEFRDAGGMINFYSLNDLEGLRAELKRTIDASRAGAPKRVLNALRALGRHMGNTNSAVENAVRLSTYANARRAGFSQDQAASLARNVTVNFTRKGEYGNVANAMYLFYNASLQGSVRLLYAISKSRRVRAILGGLAASALVWGMLNRMLAGDDDEDGENRYDKVPNYIKTRNIIFMRPDGSYWKWPLPYGYNVPWVLGTYAESALAHPEKRMEGAVMLAQVILESFNPLGGLESEDGFKAAAKLASPTIADPWVEMAINEDWAGRPIRRDQPNFGPPLPDNQLYWSSVSPTSKSLTTSLNELTGGNDVVPGAIDLNPETLDHLFSALTGGLGRAIGAGIDIPLTKAQGEALKTDQIPFVRRFVGEPSESYTFRRYDEIKDGVQLYSKRHKAMLSDADTRGEARSYREQNRVNRIMEPYVKAAESQLSTLYRQRKAIERSALDEATKKSRLERFDQQLETVRKRVIRRYNEVAADAAGKPKAQVIDLSKDPRALEIRRDYRDKRISGEEARRRLEALKAG